MGGQEGLGCRQQAALLGRRYCLLGFDQSTAPDLDLDEDQLVPVSHDQVEFSGGASPLLRQAVVSGLLKLALREMFSRVAQ